MRGIDGLTYDFRYGLRMLRKNPVYAVVSVITLALGIGASTAIFSVVYGILLRPLPYYKPEQIVRVWEVNAKGGRMQFADPNFDDLRAQVQSLQGMAEMRSREAPVSVDDQPQSVRVASVSQDFFAVMGVQPVIGRLFVPEEQQFRAASTAVVSYSYWREHLRETHDLGALKFAITKNPTRIIGVLPPGFRFPDNSDVWIPREIDAHLPSRTAHNWPVIARLRNGAYPNQAQSELSAIAQRLSQQYRLEEKNMVDAAVLPLKDAMTIDVRTALLVFLGVVGLLLLVTWANVMNLWLAHASARSAELTVRVALGASHWHLVRQLLAEALLLCFLGGLLGTAAAYLGLRVLLVLAPADIPRLDEVAVNLPVLLFALGLSVVIAVSLGLFTSVRASWGKLQTALAEDGQRQGMGVRGQRMGRIIVAGQVAITLILLTGAGLLGRSMLRVLSIQPGFETEHIATLDLRSPDLKGRTEVERVQLVDQLISRLKTLPGVSTAGGTSVLPLKPTDFSDGTFAILNPQELSAAQRDLIERSVSVDADNPDPAFLSDLIKFMEGLFSNKEKTGNADFILASEGYFETLGIPLRSGRLFNAGDGPNAPHVAVISESVAQQTWPGQDPLGRTIEFGNIDGDLRLLTIVGVVADVRTLSLEKKPRPTVYVNYRQRPRSLYQFNIVMRNGSDPSVLFGPVREILRQMDPTIPARMNTFPQIFSESVNRRRFNLLLVSAFAVTALLLAIAGVFGVLAYAVAQRTREIGVRVALGATPVNILKLVLGQGLLTIAIGAGIGLLGSFLLTRTMGALLFDVSPNDPLTIAGATLLLILIATLASYIPARRATRIDPVIALRYE